MNLGVQCALFNDARGKTKKNAGKNVSENWRLFFSVFERCFSGNEWFLEEETEYFASGFVNLGFGVSCWCLS